MLDIETLGTDSNAVVVSISAVQFDLRTGEIGDSYEQAIDLKAQVENGGVLEPDTIEWWMSQSKDAQDELSRLKKNPLYMVLYSFNEFCISRECNALWGNGATFDNVIVRNLYRRSGAAFDLPFYADRDVRTLVDLAGVNHREYEFHGIKHRGIDDCMHQIKYCIDAYQNLKGAICTTR